MILKKISILNYRNIAQTDLDFSPKINCFIGHNGEGKTNLLDAICFLSFCKSSANSVDSQNIRHDEGFFVLQGSYEAENGDIEEVYCGLKRGQKKQFKRAGKAYKKLSEHLGLIPLILVSPDDTELISGGSEWRRKFMDIVISQYDKEYIDYLLRYNKALSERNLLLKQEDEPDPELLSLYEDMMGQTGEEIYRRRVSFIEEFIPTFQEFYSFVSNDKERVNLEYVSHCQRGALVDVIRRDRAKDRIMGYTLHGVHKDDLVMSLGDYAIKREGSQGQNKTFLIALKLAQFDFLRRTGSRTTPILLLDDIFDKLDAERVEQIVKLVIGDRFGQIFITDTNRDHLDSILSSTDGDYRIFNVEAGNVKLIKGDGDKTY